MSEKKIKWKDRGFDDKHHYAGWLYFNDLTDDSKMYDDVYYDEYRGKMVNVVEPDSLDDEKSEVDDAEEFLANFEEK